jgi:hypothetical protein
MQLDFSRLILIDNEIIISIHKAKSGPINYLIRNGNL